MVWIPTRKLIDQKDQQEDAPSVSVRTRKAMSIAYFKNKIHNLTSDKRFSEILTGSVYAIVSRVLATGLAMITSIMVARFYGTEAMGILATVNSFLTLITIFTLLGTGTSILRFIPEHLAKYSVTSAFCIYRKVLYLVAGVSLVTGIFFFCASELVADKVFSKPHFAFFFALASCFVFFKSLMDLNTQAIRGFRLIRIFAVMQVVPSLLMLVLLIFGTFLFKNQNNPVFTQLAAFGLSAVIGAWVMEREFKKKMQIGDEVQPVAVKTILGISFPMLMTSSMQFFVGQTGVMLLAMFRTEGEVGYYFVADKMASLTSFILTAISIMATPKFSELYHNGKMEELFHVARKSSKLIFWTTMPILLFLVVLGKPVLSLFYGANFSVAYSPMFFLLIGQVVNSISGPTNNFLNMTGHQKVFSKIIFFAALINIGVSWALIPRFGINGAAIGGMLSLTFWNGFTLFYIKKKFGRMIGYFPFWGIGKRGNEG